MSKADQQFVSMCRDILDHGTTTEGQKVRPVWEDGTPAYTIKNFGVTARYDLREEFPALTLRRTALKSAMDEILWIYQKKSNNVHDLNSHIWDEWADENGELGPVYGRQWRAWPTSDGRTIDQISEVLERIKKNPDSRRLLVTAWNPAEVDKMALPPCHCLFQFYVADGRLSCQLYQRSCDMFLGVPFNIASYALLTHMVAQQCDLEPGDFVWTGGDCHIYDNHLEQTALQLSREPRPYPKLVIKRRPASLFEYEYEDFEFEGYDPWPGIKAPVAV